MDYLMKEKITEILCTGSNPCLYYEKVWKWFQDGDLSLEMWDTFNMACLESLIKNNKDILDRLKN